MTDKERQFLDNARQVLDDSVQDLDGATRSRLAQARNAALDSKRKRRRRLVTWGTPAAGLAAAALVAVLALRGPDASMEEKYVADLDILTSEEPLDFYEDIEFYQWLSEVAENEDDLSGDRSGVPAPVAARARRGTGPECDGSGIRDAEPRDTKHGIAGVSRLV
ncbi:DUF3619 family protein [Pseudodesulfovibrio sp.]|nr:DUF3619 family protein [Pseudodesulfovibrio sp.]